MNNPFDRMKKLLEDVGIKLENGGISSGEISAYSKGIELVISQAKMIIELVNIVSSKSNQLKRYTSLLHIDESRFEDVNQLKAEIIKRYSQCFGDNEIDAVNEGFESVGSGTYSIDNGVVTFYNVMLDDLYELGKFINGYLPAFATVSFDGTGLTFDEWDSIAFTFSKYDGWCLPFSIIDNLRSDMIEQY